MPDSDVDRATRPWFQRAYSFLCRILDEHEAQDDRDRNALKNLRRRLIELPATPLKVRAGESRTQALAAPAIHTVAESLLSSKAGVAHDDEIERYWSQFPDDLVSVASDLSGGSDRDAIMKAVDALRNKLPEREYWERLHDARGVLEALAARSEKSAAVTALNQPASEMATKRVKPKRSTEGGDAEMKIVTALNLHHEYADDGCLNLGPIGVNKLASKAAVASSTVSEFFNRKFNRREKRGHAKYRAICRDAGRLADSLKALNKDFSPHDLYGRRPPNEGDRNE